MQRPLYWYFSFYGDWVGYPNSNRDHGATSTCTYTVTSLKGPPGPTNVELVNKSDLIKDTHRQRWLQRRNWLLKAVSPETVGIVP